MSTTKTKPKQKDRIEELQHQLGEREDRLHAESVQKWILERAAERKEKPSPKSPR